MMMTRLLLLNPPHFPSGLPHNPSFPSKESLGKPPNSSGIEPDSSLEATENVFNRSRRSKPKGIEPVNLFPFKFKLFKNLQFTISGGIGPENLFPERSRLTI
ncbi:hypothetical protein OIU77_001313 [Salix suchowensis]|uniref:Uncharacterized protein n=1 Tax=Salix suchowensis TaxID=1278906 RepID=A0ABQ9B162_9ROSI|nr:hypothetical protein OIU77_001313 [Salix suchowensis]